MDCLIAIVKILSKNEELGPSCAAELQIDCEQLLVLLKRSVESVRALRGASGEAARNVGASPLFVEYSFSLGLAPSFFATSPLAPRSPRTLWTDL